MNWLYDPKTFSICSIVSIVFTVAVVILVAGLIVNNCIKFAQEQEDEPTPAQIAKERLIALKKGGR